MDLYRMFQQSGPLGWPLLACSVLAVGVALERILVFFWRGTSYPRFVARLKEALADGGVSGARQMLGAERSPLARVAEAYLEHERSPNGLREEIVAREASMRLSDLERRVHWLSVIGSLAPMIGLLGTVLGLVQAFKQIESLGGQVQPGDLAEGIWTALLTTVFGLSVALPSLAIYHFLENRVGAIHLQMQWLTATLNEWFGHAPRVAAEKSDRQQDVHEEAIMTAGD
jgi:biopolymer transport protein ExbB